MKKLRKKSSKEEGTLSAFIGCGCNCTCSCSCTCYSGTGFISTYSPIRDPIYNPRWYSGEFGLKPV
jgi:putative bacteriocin precursor